MKPNNGKVAKDQGDFENRIRMSGSLSDMGDHDK